MVLGEGVALSWPPIVGWAPFVLSFRVALSWPCGVLSFWLLSSSRPQSILSRGGGFGDLKTPEGAGMFIDPPPRSTLTDPF